MADKKKINWLLILQGWAMLWVVIGHSPLGEPRTGPIWETALYRFAYSFHMPLFMMVSGWLFYLTRLKEFELSGGGRFWNYQRIVKDKVIRLLLPGLVFSIVALALKLAFPGEMTRQTGFNLQSIVHGYLYPYDNAMRELWFIVTLFLLMLLTPVWRFIVKNSQNIVSGGLVVLALYFWHPDVELLCLGKVMSMALWFYMGLVLCRMEVVEKYLEPQPLLTMICGVAVYAIGMLVEWGVLMTIGGIVLSLGFSLLADRYVPKLFCGFRNYTYQIFLMGIFAQIAVKIVFRHVNWPYFPTYLLCMAAGLYVPVIISKIIEKISWRPLSLCVGLRIRE